MSLDHWVGPVTLGFTGMFRPQVPSFLTFSVYVCCGLLTLSACGVAYVSPRVDPADETIDVVPLTIEAVEIANQSPYEPRQVPPAFGAVATGQALATPGTPTPPASIPEQSPASRLRLSAPPDIDPGPYRIGVGDVVVLATKSSGNTVEELTGLLAAQSSRQGYTVQDDGAIAVPDVGRIQLANLTLEEAEAQLFQSLVENRIDPAFSLEIAEFRSQRVAIGGAVANPTVIPIELTPLPLDEALIHAGGLSTPNPDFASIRIYRAGALYQIPLADYLGRPDLQKLRLLASDSVFVDTTFELSQAQAYFAEQIALANLRQQNRAQALAELTAELDQQRAVLTERRTTFAELVELDAVPRDYVYLTGEVAQPSRFAMPFGRQATLADALYREGGFSSETGNPSQIYVLRGTDTATVTALHLDARNVGNLVLATRLNLRPNDIVFVAEQPVTRWNRVVQQIVPSLITGGTTLAAN